MRTWLRTVFDRLIVGLVSIDGDLGRPGHEAKSDDPGHEAQPIPYARRPPVDESAWIPDTNLYGPPR
jgi:hypothetical protein